MCESVVRVGVLLCQLAPTLQQLALAWASYMWAYCSVDNVLSRFRY